MSRRWPARWRGCKVNEHQPLRGRALAAFVLVALIWGSTWLVIRDQVQGVAIPASWTLTWRFVVAALAAFPLALLRREGVMLDRGGWAVAVALGFTQFFANYQFVYRAEEYLASGLVAVIYALLMLPNALLARLVLGTRVTRRFLAGSAVALAGIGLLMAREYAAAPLGAHVLLGAGLTVAGMLCAAVANVAQATAVGRRQPMMALVAWAMLIGAGIDAAFAYATCGPPVLGATPRYWLGVGYLGVIGSVVAFPLYFALIRQMGAGRAAYNGVAVPVVAMALSTLFEGYRWTGLAVAGSVLAMAGLLVALGGRGTAGRVSRPALPPE